MEIVTHGFAGVKRDNDQLYLTLLEASITKIDNFATAEVNKTSDELKFRICLSDSSKFEKLLQQLNKFHTQIGIRTNMSKSMKKTATLYYTIQSI